MFRCLPVIVVMLLHAGSALAVDSSPTGLWKTVDDHSHKPRALVRIDEHDGRLTGKIVRLFRDPGEDPDPRCEDCGGSLHDQPVLGMRILWGFHLHGDHWSGGRILDPETGNVYRCRVRVSSDGKKLRLRGYIGLPLFGRTQTWLRVGADALNASP